MTNELLCKYIGKQCIVSTGSFGGSVNGIITSIMENWIEIENAKGSQLLNADFVTNISVVKPKQKA